MRKQFAINLLATLLIFFVSTPVESSNTKKEKLEKSTLTKVQMNKESVDSFMATYDEKMELNRQTNTTTSCVSGTVTTLHLITDDYAGETMWRLMRGNAIVAFGAGYANSTTYIRDFNLPVGEYTFTIYDLFGDGICCNYGNGSFSLVNDATTILDGGVFNHYMTVDFCVEEPPVLGCMNPEAHNYNPDATEEDGSCETCSDGVLNGDETSVDCGGTNCAACEEEEDEGCYASSTTVLNLITDNYGHEVSWTLTGSGTVLASGGCYPDNNVITESFNLPDGTYTFNIYDSYGDGICCAYGNGSYALENGGEEIISGGDYGAGESITFCIDSGEIFGCTDPNAHNYNPDATQDDGSCETCSDGIMNGDETDVDCGGTNCEPCNDGCPSNAVTTLTLRTDNYGGETRWRLKKGNQTIARGRNYANNTVYTIDFNLPPGDDYKFVIVDSYGDGICCAYGEGYYSLDNGNTNIVSGGAFGNKEVTNFCIGGVSGRMAGEGETVIVDTRAEQLPESETTFSKDAFQVFPNPATDKINLDLSGLNAVRSVNMVTVMGQHLKQIEPNNLDRPIDVSDLPKGIYIIVVETEKGLLNKKFAKE